MATKAYEVGGKRYCVSAGGCSWISQAIPCLNDVFAFPILADVVVDVARKTMLVGAVDSREVGVAYSEEVGPERSRHLLSKTCYDLIETQGHHQDD